MFFFTAIAVVAGGWIATPGRFSPYLWLGAISAALIAAGANAYNDVVDVDSDKINHPNRPLVTEKLTPKQAIWLGSYLTLTGWIIGCFLPRWLFAIPVLVALLLLAYNRELKRKPWFGNIVVSFCGALAPVFGAWIAGDVRLGAAPGFLALCGFMLRELVKDAEDIPGDRIVGYRTAPIADSFLVFKIRFWFVSLLLAAGVLQVENDRDFHGLYFLLLAAVVLTFLVTIISLTFQWKASDTVRSRHISLLCKGMLASGLIMLVVGRSNV